MYSFVKVKYIIQNITEYMYNLFVENSINECLAKQNLLSSFFFQWMTIAVLKQLDCIISFINNGCSIRYYLSDQDYSWRTK